MSSLRHRPTSHLPDGYVPPSASLNPPDGDRVSGSLNNARLRDVLTRLLENVDGLLEVVDFDDEITERVAAGDGPSGELVETLTIRWRRP